MKFYDLWCRPPPCKCMEEWLFIFIMLLFIYQIKLINP
jgi:hypothetical protein